MDTAQTLNMATEQQEQPKWEKDFSPFKRLFREIRLQTDVGLKVHKMKRTQFDEQFYEIFNELSIITDPIERYQIELAEGKDGVQQQIMLYYVIEERVCGLSVCKNVSVHIM